MNIAMYSLIPMLVFCAGCAHLGHSARSCTFGEREVSHWHQAAVKAVNSPEEWSRLGLVQLHPELFKLDEATFNYSLNPTEPDAVEVVIHCPLTIDQPEITLRIKLDRVTGVIGSMSEVVRPTLER